MEFCPAVSSLFRLQMLVCRHEVEAGFLWKIWEELISHSSEFDIFQEASAVRTKKSTLPHRCYFVPHSCHLLPS
jgi:hypothetical protein